MNLLLAFVLAMSVTMGLIPLLSRVAGRMRLLDVPNARKVHSGLVPRVGGVAMVAGALMPMLYLLRDDARLPAFLAAALLLLAMGFWDDRAELSYLPKFGAQIAAAAIVMAWGGVMIHSVTLGDRFALPLLLAAPLTLVFLVGVTNAINLADGLDGLAGGTTLLSVSAMAVLALGIDDPFVAGVSIIVAGSILGFLRFNTYPARIFMGDGGSQFLGFTVAVTSVLLTQSSTSPYSAALPVMLLGLPLLDTLFVIAQRLREGRSPFAADRNHLHHRLLGLGFQHFEAVFIIYFLQAALFLMAWVLRYESDVLIVAAYVAFAGFVLAALQVADAQSWRWRLRPAGNGPDMTQASGSRTWRALRAALPRWTLACGGGLVAAYALRTAWAATPVPADIGWLALGLAGCLAVTGGLALARPVPGWPAHLALYVAAVVVVFLDLTVAPPLPGAAEKIALALAAACVMLSFRLTAVRRFELTPLDFLVIFVVLALPNLMASFELPPQVGLGAIKLLLLFYALEMLLNHSPRSRVALHACGFVVLCLLGSRALA